MRTHAQVVTAVEAKLPTVTSPAMGDTTIAIAEVLREISQKVPLWTPPAHADPDLDVDFHAYSKWAPTKGVYTTDGTTREIRLTEWDSLDMVGLSQYDGVEYPVDEEPREFKNFDRNFQPGVDRILSLLLDNIPDASESIYIYPKRQHILQASIGTTDLTGTVNGTRLAGDTFLILAGLGTGTINKYTGVTILNSTTKYMVTQDATISGNAARIKILPPLVGGAANGDTIALTLADSTLALSLEDILIKWTAGKLLVDYSDLLLMQSSPRGSPVTTFAERGYAMIAHAQSELRRYIVGGQYVQQPRS